jgi:hypothetical protein
MGEIINNSESSSFCISFSMKKYSKDTTRVYIDGIEKGNIPMMTEVTEGTHRIKVALLINFMWKEKSFDLDVHQNTLVVVDYNRFFGTYSVMVDGEKKA